MARGIKFFLSGNGVVLSPGDDSGHIPPETFLSVFSASSSTSSSASVCVSQSPCASASFRTMQSVVDTTLVCGGVISQQLISAASHVCCSMDPSSAVPFPIQSSMWRAIAAAPIRPGAPDPEPEDPPDILAISRTGKLRQLFSEILIPG